MELTEAQARRAKKWEEEFIACKNHPERRCTRYQYVRRSTRRCSSCCTHRADGTRKPGYDKYIKAAAKGEVEQVKWRRRSTALAKRIIENRI